MIQASNITKYYGGLRAFVPEGLWTSGSSPWPCVSARFR